jgi:hypothetical protein
MEGEQTNGDAGAPRDTALPPPLPPSPSPPLYRLYDAGSVGIATLLGSPLAGAVVMAINYHRLGRKGAAWGCFFGTLIGTVALLAIGALLPESFARPALALGPLIAMWWVAQGLQGGAIVEHTSIRHGQLASRWKAAGIGLIGLVLILGIVFGVIWFTTPGLGPKITVNGVEEVYYEGQSTEADARKLGDWLATRGFFNGKSVKTVVLRKTKDQTSVSIVVSAQVWNDPTLVEGFKSVGAKLVMDGFGKPLVVRLCDNELTVKKEIKVE